jgi:VanZ family protein
VTAADTRPAEGKMITSRERTIQFLWLWLPVLVYMAGIFIGSSMPDPPVPANVPDVSLHESAYFGLTLLLIRALARERWDGVTARALALAWLIAVAYGVTDEWHQSFVPNRFSELRDLQSDAIGAFAASAVVGAWSIIRRL